MILGKVGNRTISDVVIHNLNEEYVDSSVKTAILLMLAGYLERDDIWVDGHNIYNKKYLNKFLSYLLNDKRAAPRDFDINISFSETIKVKPQSNNDFDLLLSFSGGVDSTAGLLHALDYGLKVKPVFIGFGQKNEQHELVTVTKILNKLNIKPLIIKIDIAKYIDQDWKRWKLGIIPARNYLFTTIAGSIISKSSSRSRLQIWICAHKEEINPANTDKSKRFFNSSSKIISNVYKKNILVTTPFKEMTKPEIISVWHKKWEKRYGIYVKDTISCYFGTNCGICKACINRAISFVCAGLKIEYFKVNPFLDQKKLIHEAYIERFGSLRKERKIDFLYAMDQNRQILPSNLRFFLDKNYKKYKTSINTRIDKIRKIDKI